MKEYSTQFGKVMLVETESELPRLSGHRLYKDMETTSGDDNVKAFDPWAGHRIAGAAVTSDSTPDVAWYIPLRHRVLGAPNISLDAYHRWSHDILESHDEWRNNNVKFDAHFEAAECVELKQLLAKKSFVDIIVGCKMLDSDRGFGRGTYELDSLSLDFLGVDISDGVSEIDKYLHAIKSKDYGALPMDLVAPYAGTDVFVSRALDLHVDQNLPSDCKCIWSIERALTPVMFDVEQRGMHVIDQIDLRKRNVLVMTEMLALAEMLHKVADFPLRPNVTDDLHELICVQWGFPVISRTEKGNPSFDAKALKLYAALPEMQEEPYKTAMSGILRYKKLETLRSLFIEPYMQMARDGLLHPKYNQCVRTGRTSCSDPNAQQLSVEAKELINCLEGRALLAFDYSQLEYRGIAHFIKDERIIGAYLANPDTDFHQSVAELCGIARRPAKNVNFGAAYGMGIEKTLEMLAMNEDIINSVAEATTVEQKKLLIRARANEVYDGYHANMPTLKPTMKRAERICKQYGYSKTAHGRRRHLDKKFAWLAFSATCQGTGADICKERMVATSSRYWDWARDNDVNQIAMIHDELLHDVPADFINDPRNIATIAYAMEELEVPLRVPMRVEATVSTTTWAACKNKDAKRPIDRSLKPYSRPTWKPEAR